MSTLALFINTDLWTAAGLTDADIPTTWDRALGGGPEADNAGGVSGSPSARAGTASTPSWCRTARSWSPRTAQTVTANDPKNVEALKYVK